MKVNNLPTPFTASADESSVEIVNGKFNIATPRKEGGLFQLVDFDAAKLRSGTFLGTDFRLLFVSSPYKLEACTDALFKNNSKLVIEDYRLNIKGYYAGILDCDGTTIEFQIPFDVKSPSASFNTTNFNTAN
jgi:hypothetical protein